MLLLRGFASLARPLHDLHKFTELIVPWLPGRLLYSRDLAVTSPLPYAALMRESYRGKFGDCTRHVCDLAQNPYQRAQMIGLQK